MLASFFGWIVPHVAEVPLGAPSLHCLDERDLLSPRIHIDSGKEISFSQPDSEASFFMARG